MKHIQTFLIAIIIFSTIGNTTTLLAKTQARSTASNTPFTYADVADLVIISPIILTARIRKSTRLAPERSLGLAPGTVRLHVEADILSLIRSPNPLTARLSWLIDSDLDANGKIPKFKKQHVLIFARPAIATSGMVDTRYVQLVNPHAQLIYHSTTDKITHRILNEITASGIPSKITGIASGFHVAGTLPNEGETQIFLDTQSDEPMTLTVVRSANGLRRWSAIYGEIVDETAQAPRKNTLTWYRLACGLPPRLPASVTDTASPQNRRAVIEDYQFIKAQLGICERTPKPRLRGMNR